MERELGRFGAASLENLFQSPLIGLESERAASWGAIGSQAVTRDRHRLDRLEGGTEMTRRKERQA
jgi:hypothetical protein